MVGQVNPSFNIDDVHRDMLEQVIRDHGLTALTDDDREAIHRTWHALDAWPDFPAALARLRTEVRRRLLHDLEHVAHPRRVA
jgi:2-haloacid dehalogenase